MRSPLQCCAALVFCLHLHLPAGLQSVPKQRAWGASPTPAKPLCTITCPSSRAALPRAVIVTSSIHFWGCFFTFSPVPIQAFLFPLCLHFSQGQARRWPHPGGVRHGAGSWHSPAWSPILCLAAGCRAGMLPTGQLLLWVNYLCWALFILLLHSFFVFISLQYSQLEYPNENVKVRNHKHTV